MGACVSTNSTIGKNNTKLADDSNNAWERIRQVIPRENTPEAKQRRIDLFKKFDKNNSGKLSYDEVYDGCLNVLKLDEFTTRLRDITKRAFNRAKDMGNKVANKGSEDFVEFMEFRLFLCYVYDYFDLMVMFDKIDTSGNMLIDEKEFKKAVPKLEKWGAKIDDPSKVFKEVDANGSGSVTFDEFAAWACATKLSSEGDSL